MIHRFVVPPEQAGARVDQFLVAQVAARALPITRSQVKRHIDEGHVTVLGVVVKPARKLRAGEKVRFEEPPPVATTLVPEDLPLAVLYEDAYLIAIDKAAGMVVHPSAGHATGTLVHALLHHCGDLAGIGGELRPGIVHRLDRDTTGVLVATKDDTTHEAIAALFRKKDLVRLYVALVAPAPRADEGVFRTMYGRHATDRKRFSSTVATGKRAVTHYRVLERFGVDAALIECRLETGRTHQIRVHMADHGHPVLGDQMYGRPPRARLLRELGAQLGRQALHARRLAFVHPRTGAPMQFESPVPADFAAALAALRTAL